MLLTVLLAAAAAGVLAGRPHTGARLHGLAGGGAGRPGDDGRPAGPGRPASPDRPADPGPPGRPGAPPGRLSALGLPRVACLVAGVGAVVLVGGVPGLVLGALVALAGPRALAGLEPRALREEREQLARDLPLALDLLAACLAGGAPLPHAVAVVAEALPGPCGTRLVRVAAHLGLGSPAAEAWAPLLHGSDAEDVAAGAVRALVRSGDGGAPVAEAVARAAEESRVAARSRAEQAARRAGVLAVAPLGLCFLPAFVLLGVVPVVVGLAGPLLAGF